MAEEQNLPNEEDVKKPEAALEAKASDVEIEIEDDTPEEDQNRKNLPKELVHKLESDELDDYDDKVKDKIYQLKKVWHDERREKERIARENAEAIRAAQKLREENKQLKANSENNFLTLFDLMYKILCLISVLQFSDIIILAPFFIALLINLFPSNKFPFIAKKIFPGFIFLLSAEIPEKEYLEYFWLIFFKKLPN